jgi:NAD(P)-dependent dehydrogenase (short-subunit alcohol dehydrogenase family)
MMKLEGVRAVITGAASGIGKAIAVRFASEGASVFISDINAERLENTVSQIKASGGKAAGTLADVSKEDDVRRLAAAAAESMGGIDVLVNNAGTGTIGYMEQIVDAEIDRAFGVNLTGVMRVTRACVPYLKKSGRGRIINMSSVEGIRGSAFLPVYCVTKSGVIGLTMANAMELAKFKVTVNAICPGPIETDMLAPLISSDEYRQKMVKAVPLKRIGRPEDIAGAALFLASEDSSFITGHSLVVDGGMTVRN